MVTKIKRSMLSWLLVLTMMVGLMPVIGGNVYAEDLNTGYSQGYRIENVQVQDNSAEVLFSTKSDALLFAAVYDENGRQKMLTSRKVSSDQTTAILSFDNAVSADDTAKIFMVDTETQKPLCEEYARIPGVISDSWEQIIASINDGTYKDKYKIGDTKELDLGPEGIVDMQIAALDAEELADETGTASITWISKQLLKSEHRMNPYREYNSDTDSYVLGTGSIGGWNHSEMRVWLNEYIKPLIPLTIRNAIKPVKKYSSSWDTSLNYEHNSMTIDNVWIPSHYEIFGTTVSRWDYYETAGPTYTGLFAANGDRIKQKVGEDNVSGWWLRSANHGANPGHGSNGIRIVGNTGDDRYTDGAGDETSVALGFCLGATKSAKSTVDLGSANVGDYVTFGHYEQDNNTDNGKEAIEWKVLDKANGRVLLLSKYGLDAKPYNEEYTDVTWETCTLRNWLNSNFFDEAFSTSEKSAIPMVTLSNPDNPNYGTTAGNNTNDQVFLLNLQEMQQYFTLSDNWTDYDGEDHDVAGANWSFGGSKDIITSPTAYAKAQGVYASSFYHDEEGKESCDWWLRSPGGTGKITAYVSLNGDVKAGGYSVDYDGGVAVRPALWVNLAF